MDRWSLSIPSSCICTSAFFLNGLTKNTSARDKLSAPSPDLALMLTWNKHFWIELLICIMMQLALKDFWIWIKNLEFTGADANELLFPLFHNYDTNVILPITKRAKNLVSHHFASCSGVLSQYSQCVFYCSPLIQAVIPMNKRRNCIAKICATCQETSVLASLNGSGFITIDTPRDVNSLYMKVKLFAIKILTLH